MAAVTTRADWSALYREIADGAVAREAAGAAPFDAVAALKAAGFGAQRLPPGFGPDRSLVELFREVIALAAADANVAHIFRNHFFILEFVRDAPRTPARRALLEQVADGALIGMAVTDVRRTRDTEGRATLGGWDARVTESADGLVLNGHKQYATGSLFGDLLGVFANDPRRGEDVSVTVIVPAHRPGVEIFDDWGGFGQRFTGTGTVLLTDVAITEDDIVLGGDGEGFTASYNATVAQLFLTAAIAGIVRAAADDALRLVRTKRQNLPFAPSHVRAEDPVQQQVLGRLEAQAFAAEAIVLHAAADLDRAAGQTDVDLRHRAALSAARAKVVLDELAPVATSALFDCGGASATLRAEQLDRHWRNARTLASHNAAVYKAQRIGAYLATGERLPSQGYF